MTKEGLYFPLPFLAAAGISFLLFNKYLYFPWLYLAGLLFFLALAVMLFFRDPDRKIPGGEKLVLSPADGKIIKIDDDSDEPGLSIFLSIFNVHVNRSPVSGKVRSVDFFKGKFFTAFKDEAQKENQRNEIKIETPSGMVRFHQVTGAIARRTIFWQKPGQSVEAGEKVGLIRFGSRVDLTLPQGSVILVHMGQKVVGGETILGQLP